MFQIIDLILSFMHSTVVSLQIVLQLVYPLFLTGTFFMLLRSSLSFLSILIKQCFQLCI